MCGLEVLKKRVTIWGRAQRGRYDAGLPARGIEAEDSESVGTGRENGEEDMRGYARMLGCMKLGESLLSNLFQWRSR